MVRAAAWPRLPVKRIVQGVEAKGVSGTASCRLCGRPTKENKALAVTRLTLQHAIFMMRIAAFSRFSSFGAGALRSR